MLPARIPDAAAPTVRWRTARCTMLLLGCLPLAATASEPPSSAPLLTQLLSDHPLALWLGATLLVVLLASLLRLLRLQKLNRQLRWQAETDALTGLPNRNALNPSFSIAILRAQRYGRPLSVILLDIDHFKKVNDDFGHLTGDKVLEAFAALLQGSLREVDTVCRWGGEEFLVVCHETDLEQARQLAERILARVRQHAFPCPRALTASAGVATVVRSDTAERLMQRADESLYDAKHHGRDQVGVKLLDAARCD